MTGDVKGAPLARTGIVVWVMLAAFWTRRVGATDGPDSILGFRYSFKERVESFRLFGNLNKYAYYFTDLLIGWPAQQRVSVIVDTGSRMVGFPCSECTQCGDHLDPPFDIEKSPTARWTQCYSDCTDSCRDGRCSYTETYAEGSSIAGYWFEDMVALGDSIAHNPPVRARVGCHTSEDNLFFTQKASGIMGLALSAGTASQPTILKQLFANKSQVKTNMFSLCLATWGGRMTVGGFNASYHTSTIDWVKMESTHYYFLNPQALTLGEGEKAVAIASDHNDFDVSIVDSGTTYTYLPERICNKLVYELDVYCEANDACGADKVSDQCWQLRDSDAGPTLFPPLSFDFGAERRVVWKATAYLHQRGEVGHWCRTFMENNIVQTVFGISFMLHKDFVFDVGGKRLGIADADCPEYHEQPDLDLQEKFSANAPWPVAAPRLGGAMRSWAPSQMAQLRSSGGAWLPAPMATAALLATASAAAAALGCRRASRGLSSLGGSRRGSQVQESACVDSASELEMPERSCQPLVGAL